MMDGTVPLDEGDKFFFPLPAFGRIDCLYFFNIEGLAKEGSAFQSPGLAGGGRKRVNEK
jgi:hypothetical protein